MNLLGDIKLSRLQLIVIVIVLSLIVFFVMSFSSDDNNKPRLISGNEAQQKKAELTQALVYSLNKHTGNQQSRESMAPSNGNIEFSTIVSHESNSSVLDAVPINAFSLLDDESLLNISDILENSLVPTFLSNIESTEQHFDQKAALDVFVSRLPEGLNDTVFQQINSLLRDYLPYDLADGLIQEIEEAYHLSEQEQAYLSSELAHHKLPEKMAEQVAIATHLASLQGESVQQELDSEPSKAYSDWQKTQDKLEKIQYSSNDSLQGIHEVIKHEYGSEVADDYLELSATEKQWQEKYAVFLEEKNIISRSGLSDDDKTEQIERLIQQHYEENEWAAVRAYDGVIQNQVE
jgi:hypothetical protein